jgi:hypothetical protein
MEDCHKSMANKRRKPRVVIWTPSAIGVVVNAIFQEGSLTVTMCPQCFQSGRKISFREEKIFRIQRLRVDGIWDICCPNLSSGVGEENANRWAGFNQGCADLLKRFSDHVSFAQTRVEAGRGMVQRIKPNDLRTYFDPGAISYSAARAEMMMLLESV